MRDGGAGGLGEYPEAERDEGLEQRAEEVAVAASLLSAEGALVVVGLPSTPSEIHVGGLIGGNKVLAGSNIGGIPETQEMLDFCADHDLGAWVQIIGGDDIDQAYDDVVSSKARYRYVIDTSTFND